MGDIILPCLLELSAQDLQLFSDILQTGELSPESLEFRAAEIISISFEKLITGADCLGEPPYQLFQDALHFVDPVAMLAGLSFSLIDGKILRRQQRQVTAA